MKILGAIILLALNGCVRYATDNRSALTQEHADSIEGKLRLIQELREQIDDYKETNLEIRNAGRRISGARYAPVETKADLVLENTYPSEDRLSDLQIIEAILKREIASLKAEGNALREFMLTDTFEGFGVVKPEKQGDGGINPSLSPTENGKK